MNFKIGQNVNCIFDNGAHEVSGTIIKIVEPFQGLTEDELLEYANVRNNHVNYKTLEGKHCKVVRLVLETCNGYTIVPVNFKRWKIEVMGLDKEEIKLLADAGYTYQGYTTGRWKGSENNLMSMPREKFSGVDLAKGESKTVESWSNGDGTFSHREIK